MENEQTSSKPPLPRTASETTAENPWPVHVVSEKIEGYIDRMAPMWVSGQLVELNRRPGAWMAYLTLRDENQDMSLAMSVPDATLKKMDVIPQNGATIAVHCKPGYWKKRGRLTMPIREIRLLGEGDLLAKIEQLKQTLSAEGLFDTARKKPLPFLPRVVGLVCGRNSAAERDVVVTATSRWPGVRFEIREVAVQGDSAVREVSQAVSELDAIDEVDVIVIARGGGSLEDLLAFSDERLVRHVAGLRTPTVSAIGHEVDNPVLDYVADVRAVTPTDAGKRVVPAVSDELEGLDDARSRLRRAMTWFVRNESQHLAALRQRPVLSDPLQQVRGDSEKIDVARARLRNAALSTVQSDQRAVQSLRDRLLALSPQATLARGYAVIQHQGHAVTSTRDLDVGVTVNALLHEGTAELTVSATTDAEAST